MDKKRRVLIADDENVNREFFDIMLGNLDFIVDKAEDGEAVFELIKKNKPDIIIIDDMLPLITGWQIIRLLKTDKKYSDFSDIPVIMLSEMADPEAVVEGFSIGVDDYIRKPFSFAVVYARIKAALRNRETMYKRAQHEETVAVIKSLSNTFEFLSDHLKTPVGNLKSAISDFSTTECIDRDMFVNLISENTNRIMAALESLSEQIAEIKKTENAISSHSLDISDLEKRYRSIRNKMKTSGGV
ncbi:MAG: response regulator transcription factor [Spirochaetia bacterium]|jgi:CheY-like chemotaxis protein|nr:response regulator transcription factor [Spirochaetia bacterium]